MSEPDNAGDAETTERPQSDRTRGSAIERALPIAHTCLFAAVVVWMLFLWPSDSTQKRLEKLREYSSVKTEGATITSVSTERCGNEQCTRIQATIDSGTREGDEVPVAATDRRLSEEVREGDAVRLLEVSRDRSTSEKSVWLLADHDRLVPTGILVALFVMTVAAFGRWHGVRALIGLSLGIAVLLFFLVPGVLEGRPPLAIAVVSALAIMYLVLPLTHGFSLTTLAAMTGTVLSLTVIVTLAAIFTDATHLSGFISEESLKLREAGISLEGLVLGGMIIGAMGVLDDVTVSQASTVLALRRANPDLGMRALLSGALDVGRDHVAATVNTLVLAYAGASLSVLLFVVVGDRSFADAVNVEAISAPVVAMLVGSIGLVLAMPLTTACAAWLAIRIPAERLKALGDGHHHHHH